jgi:predicted hydrocarbon binding protein
MGRILISLCENYMHGLIFLQLQKFAQNKAGPQAWEILLKEANLPVTSYSPVRAYPDQEVFAIVGAASRILNQTPSQILEAFGEFIAPELIRLYGRMLDPKWKTLDVIENTEKLVHTAVRVGNPGAKPPVLECIRTTENELQIMYSSERQMCQLAKGIITGIARHFGETITVTDDACMHRGDPFCAMQVTRTNKDIGEKISSEVFETKIYQITPFSGTGSLSQITDSMHFSFLNPPLMSDELGRLADFRVLQLIGQGGMGIVFRADDSRLGRIIALKVMLPQLASDAIMRERFIREAKALAAIKSDYVVTVHEVGTANNLPFLAMEFLEGEVLEIYHETTKNIPVQQVVRIGKEIAAGLAAAHARGIVHRDIKPGNIWLEESTGRVKILDFGLVLTNTDSRNISRAGMILGTPAFMAPEQARGGNVDYRADLFSLGCVLYLLATNENPFKKDDVLSTLTALANYDPPHPQTLSPNLPPALSELIIHLVQKDPVNRPSSSLEVRNILADIEHKLTFANTAARNSEKHNS